MKQATEEIRTSPVGKLWTMRNSENADAITDELRAWGWCVLTVSGCDSKTKHGLISAIRESGKFPKHFGWSWQALSDCLTDLSWLPDAEGYALVFKCADSLLCEEDAIEYETFQSVLNDVIETWGDAAVQQDFMQHPKRSVPFHGIFFP